MQRFAFALVALMLTTLLLPASAAHAAPQCFPEVAAVRDCIDGRIKEFWQQHGGLSVFGYPLGPERTEQTDTGRAPTQFFERTRLERHPENPAPYDVLLGRLGVESLQRQGRDWTTLPKGNPAAAHYFAETGHAVAPEFWGYWSSHGLEFDGQRGTSFAESLALFGMPITEPQIEVSPTDGKSYLTQWFERARFEYHPENAGTPYEVLLGLLQRELLAGSPAPATQPATQPAATNLPPGGFIQATGKELTRLGQPVQLKGVNYYPQWRPWAEMWWRWDGPQMERELRMARDQLGINTVRILVPYNFRGEKDGLGKTPPELIIRLREITQIAGNLDMRLIVTLFDFYVNFEAPGTRDWDRDVSYAQTVVSAFANDERILAWDLHNEPDHYGAWNDDAGRVLNWLSHMADEVRAVAPNQLITVGMGQYTNLFLVGPDGRRVLDYSDVISVHTYDAGKVRQMLDEVRAQTTKPIIIEEFGWPTDPQCIAPNYNEATQAGLYRTVLEAARGRTSGVVAWTLRDYDSPRTDRWDGREEHFGLYRADNTLKPAAQEFIGYKVGPLPSQTTSNVPLTTTEPDFPTHIMAPLQIPGTKFYVKGMFRRAWELMGGQESFGLPIGDAFERMPDRRVVQYFERAVLEHNPDGTGVRGYHSLPDIEKARLVIIPQPLGANALGAKRVPGEYTVQGDFRALYDRVSGDWRLGAAISPEQTETINGVPTRVQYFERGRIEWDAAAQTPVLSALGNGAWRATCEQVK